MLKNSSDHQVLKGFYHFQYGDSDCVYLLKDPQLNRPHFEGGLISQYSVDGGKVFHGNGFFPFGNCNYFRKLKRKPRTKA